MLRIKYLDVYLVVTYVVHQAMSRDNAKPSGWTQPEPLNQREIILHLLELQRKPDEKREEETCIQFENEFEMSDFAIQFFRVVFNVYSIVWMFIKYRRKQSRKLLFQSSL